MSIAYVDSPIRRSVTLVEVPPTVHSSEARPTFAHRLNYLIDQVHPAGRGPYSDDEIAAAVGVSAQAVRYWRQGLRVDPRMGNLQGLADLFGVPVAYFFDDTVADQLDAELSLLSALRDQGVCQIALRAAGLSPRGQQAIVEVIRQIRQLEGLAPDDPGFEQPPRAARRDQRRSKR